MSDPALDQTGSLAAVDPGATWTAPPGGAAPGGAGGVVAPPGYEVLGELGRGGMGVVYQARQVNLNRVVALKTIRYAEVSDPVALVRFWAEAEVVAAVRHPHVVQVYDFGQCDRVPYLAMEFLPGGTLAARIAAAAPVPCPEAVGLVGKLARAVAEAHSQGIVHRDLKPGNVLFDAAGEPKVTDFGLAKRATGSDLTKTQALIGTPAYMAPEQAGRKAKFVGPAADVWALGVILYECLTGKRPFDGDDPWAVMRRVVADDPAPPRRLAPAVPRDVELICLKCLQKDPADRYPSAKELAEDLRRAGCGEPVSVRAAGPVERAAKWAKRNPTLAAAYGLGALAALLTGFGISLGVLWRQAEDARGAAEAARAVADGERQEADAQRRRAEENAAEADRQRAAVAANLQKRLDVVDDILFNMDARLANEPGLDSIRREFLEEIRRLSGQLLADNPDDPQVVRSAARVHRAIGDVARTARDYPQADAAYRTAAGYGRLLTARFPDRPDYAEDLARTAAGWAHALGAAKQLAEALDRWDEAGRLYDRLAAAGRRDAASRSARAAYYRANVLEEQKKVAEAVAGYRDALARQAKLAGEDGKDADVREDLGFTAHSLALAVERDAPDEAAALLRRAVAAHREAARAAPRAARYAANVRDAYDDYAQFCRRHHRDADLAALAAEYAADPANRQYARYNAACYLALAAKAAAADSARPEAERRRRADGHAKQAFLLLDQATGDFTTADRVHLLKDPDWDGLRDRAEFGAVVAKLDKRFPGRAVTPADLLASLREEYETAKARYDRLRAAAVSVAEKKRAARARPDFARFADRMLQLAEKTTEVLPPPLAAAPPPAGTRAAPPTESAPPPPAARSPAGPAPLSAGGVTSGGQQAPRPAAGPAPALDAILWVLETGATLPGQPPVVEKAVARLEAFLDTPGFAGAVRPLAARPSPAGDKLLEKAAARHPDPGVRGLAAFALGESLARQAEAAPPGGDAQARLARAAEAQFDRVARDHAEVAYRDATLGAAARQKLHELRSLAVGRPAREIDGADLDGKPLALSAYRGKVTLVFFWANWCGYCRSLYPVTREWVERYRGKPFALVGVNCDDDKEAARRAVARQRLPWRSWWDGEAAADRTAGRAAAQAVPRSDPAPARASAAGPAGRISEEWRVDAFPTLYLIDEAGVIRKKWQGMPDPQEVDEAIDRLLRAAGRAKAAREPAPQPRPARP